ncbi:hypothetical protein [Ferrimonas marina]|uniref:Entry exclusion lipoprotein TrbK n=1 Tax=Ferrimonas marina TaxID=299255 RepID=A0A1M5RA30_9GAMM|nr:hypothetical protein [Ferrimonas marina]SHH22673.1 hypothetical protein SAMN02745129_1528 [Ferrimonas marina]
MKKTLLALAALTLVGCGGPEAVWTHPSKDNQGFLADREFCTRRIDPAQANFQGRFEECMGQFGWSQQAK